MIDEIYQGHFGWAMTPDEETSARMRSLAMQQSANAQSIAARPCMILAAGKVQIPKRKIIELRNQMLDLKNERFFVEFSELSMESLFLVCRQTRPLETIQRLSRGLSTHLQTYLQGNHADPLNTSVPLAILKSAIEPQKIQIKLEFEHLQFAELDQNFFLLKPLIRIF